MSAIRRAVFRVSRLEVRTAARGIPRRRYEAGADIGPGKWINLRIDIDDRQLKVIVDGREALALTETKAVPAAGAVGLFVDIGTEAFFSNLTIVPR
jgi:hypothetical protein